MFSSILFGIAFLIICYIGIGLYYALPFILIGVAVGIVIWLIIYFVLKKKGKLQKQKSEKKNTMTDLANALTNVATQKGATVILKEKPKSYYLDGIDFGAVETVDIIDSQMTYIIEEREEFDPVMTNFLTEMDGWQHYETKTVEYQVENGYEYTFLICYRNGTQETRIYHEASPVAQKLIEISENKSLQKNVADAFTYAAEALNNLVKTESENAEDEYNDENLNEYADLPINDFVVFDVETTGLDNNYLSSGFDEIISVSIIDENGNVLLDKRCDTERKQTWYEAQKIHGISPEAVKGLPTFSDILGEVLQILSAHRGVIGYNILFELQFISGYVRRNPDFSDLYKKINWRLDLDVMEMYKYYSRNNKWVKLENAAKSFGYTFNAHNSLEDAKATLFLFNKIREEEFRK